MDDHDHPRVSKGSRKKRPADFTRKRKAGNVYGNVYLGKLFFQIIQLIHHGNISKDQAEGKLPKAFEKKVSGLNKFVRPARPSDSVRSKIQKENTSWAMNLGRIMRNHYSATLNSVISGLRGLNPTRETFLDARLTAIRWATKNYGKKLKDSTLDHFGTTLREIFNFTGWGNVGRNGNNPKTAAGLVSRQSSAQPSDTPGANSGRKQFRKHVTATERGLTSRLSDTQNSAGVAAFANRRPLTAAGPSKQAQNTRRGTPRKPKTPTGKRFVNDVDYLSHINDSSDPAHPGFPCSVSFQDSFDNASFASGTHALAYARATYMNMGQLADAIFRADTARDVEKLCRVFPGESDSWRQHAEGLLWETLEWKMTHVPDFARRLRHSDGVNFRFDSADHFWGVGPDGRGENVYGKSLSDFRDVKFGRGRLGLLSQSTDSEPNDSSTPTPRIKGDLEGKLHCSRPELRSQSPNQSFPTIVVSPDVTANSTVIVIDNTTPQPQRRTSTVTHNTITPVSEFTAAGDIQPWPKPHTLPDESTLTTPTRCQQVSLNTTNTSQAHGQTIITAKGDFPAERAPSADNAHNCGQTHGRRTMVEGDFPSSAVTSATPISSPLGENITTPPPRWAGDAQTTTTANGDSPASSVLSDTTLNSPPGGSIVTLVQSRSLAYGISHPRDARLYSRVLKSPTPTRAGGTPLLRAGTYLPSHSDIHRVSPRSTDNLSPSITTFPPSPGRWDIDGDCFDGDRSRSPPAGLSTSSTSPKSGDHLVDKSRHNLSIHKAADWNIGRIKKGMLVIGDSNVNRISRAPVARVWTESFPEAQIKHIQNVLGKLATVNTTQPDVVILSVGINDSQNNPESTTIPSMRKLTQKARKIFPRARVAVPMINCPAHFSKQHKDHVKQLNDSLAGMVDITVLPELDNSKFRTVEGDLDWTPETANALMAHWTKHLNC